MGQIKDDYTWLTDENPPRYRYYPDTDELFILVDQKLVDEMGLYNRNPEALPYYARMEDRLGCIGVWLYWPDLEMNYKFKEKVLWG